MNIKFIDTITHLAISILILIPIQIIPMASAARNLTATEDRAMWEIQELTRQCNNGTLDRCTEGIDISEYFKKFDHASHFAEKACELGRKNACIKLPEFAASSGDYQLYLSALNLACTAGSNIHCLLEKSKAQGKEKFESILSTANPHAFKTYKAQIFKEAEAENHTRQYLADKEKCESGATQLCLKAGKALAAKESHTLALPLFESACDRKSAEACELAGLSAAKLDQGDYAQTLVGISCKLGRLSACRIQGKIAQEMKIKEKLEEENLNSELTRKDQIERERRDERARLAEEREQERIEEAERARRNAALISSGKALGEAIAGVPPAGTVQTVSPSFEPQINTRNRRKCTTKRSLSGFGNGIETVCEDD